MDLSRCCFDGLLVLCLYFSLTSASPPKSLKFVSVLYRHGDRSPEQIYPTDINQVPDAWPDGYGWLSEIGRKQQYRLGQYLKNRYDGFINTTRYNNREIIIEASSYPRCLMSAYSNLAGLFPPNEGQMVTDKIKWQPIPVQSSPKLKDNKLALWAPCPRYDELLQQVLDSPEIVQEEIDNKEFYDMVVRETQVAKESIVDIWAVADATICEKAHNMTLNNWVTKVGVYEKLYEVFTLGFEILYRLPEMAKLKGGPLLGEIVQNMQDASNTTSPLPKFRMYSAHDTTIAALLSAMQVWDKHQSPYRALVMIEMHQEDSGNFVKVLYRNDTNHEPYELTPPGCESPCRLDTFVKVTKARIPTNWESECRVNGSSTMFVSPVYLLYLVILMSVIHA